MTAEQYIKNNYAAKYTTYNCYSSSNNTTSRGGAYGYGGCAGYSEYSEEWENTPLNRIKKEIEREEEIPFPKDNYPQGEWGVAEAREDEHEYGDNKEQKEFFHDCYYRIYKKKEKVSYINAFENAFRFNATYNFKVKDVFSLGLNNDYKLVDISEYGANSVLFELKSISNPNEPVIHMTRAELYETLNKGCVQNKY